MPNQPFEIALVGKIKHGAIRKALTVRGWTQRQGAEFMGINYQTFCRIAGLRKIPNLAKMKPAEAERWKQLTGLTPEELWPAWLREKAFDDLPKEIEFFREVTPQILANVGLLELPMTPDETLERETLRKLVDEAVKTLPPSPREAIIAELEGEAVETTARRMQTTTSNVYAMKKRALCLLRTRYHGKDLRRFLGEVPRRR